MDDHTELRIRTPPPDCNETDLIVVPAASQPVSKMLLLQSIAGLFVAGILLFIIGAVRMSAVYFLTGVTCLFLSTLLGSLHGPFPTARRPRLPSLYDTP